MRGCNDNDINYGTKGDKLMTLNRQLWLAIALLMAISFVGSFITSSLSAKNYLEEQLHLKNIDNANALALSLSSSDNDPVTMDLLLSAQYDSGHYQFIKFTDTDNNIVHEHRKKNNLDSVPQWLVTFFPINPQAGTAHVSDGWRQLGTLTLQSDNLFAYQELWNSTQRLFGYFVVAAIFAGICGSLLLHTITRPLTTVVKQARAMEQRQFITVKTPKTLEFKMLTEAMNSLSHRVKQMLADESNRLADLHKSLERDDLTGFLNREPFLEKLNAHLQREDGSSAGTLVIIRILKLADLNKINNREFMDLLLKQFGQQLTAHEGLHKNHIHGRLNGSDFALLAPQEFDAQTLARHMRELVISCASELGLEERPEISAAAGLYQSDDTASNLLCRIDAALTSAEVDDKGTLEIASYSAANIPHSKRQKDDWHNIINTALTQQSIKLASYPVYNRDNTLLHWEVPSRLITEDKESLTAAQFMPWVNRLEFSSQFDYLIVELALEKIQQEGQPLGVNLLARTLGDSDTLEKIIQLIRKQPESASLLWLEISESGVYQHLDSYRDFCRALKPLGCKLGIEHVGRDIAHIGQLYDLGLDYLKLDSSLCTTVHNNQGNQAFIRGLCTIAHSIGLLAIAEGVGEQQAWDCLLGLGIDGGTGAYFS
jgi:EAL domain-containing protein (putative c-di-GMP-specific phosphodiesterase class I)/GGDEF domain-containing protein